MSIERAATKKAHLSLQGLWLVVPLLIVNSLGSTIGQALRCHARDVIEESERLGEIDVHFSTSNGTDLQSRLEPLEQFMESDRHEEILPEEQESGEELAAAADEEEQEQIVFNGSPLKVEIKPETPVKRGRGRPRKSEAPASAIKREPGTPSSFISDSSAMSGGAASPTAARAARAARRQTRSMSKQL